jgi:ABC-type polysaccharide/polyol phosphate export permease
VTTEPGAYSDVEYVFEPHSPALPDLREYAHSLWERRQFMVELARADLRSLRTSTALGNIWNVLDPLFQAAIYYFLYAVLRKGTTSSTQFLPVLIGGFFLFGLSMGALGEGGSSIKRAKGLLLASTFPRALLPITTVYKSVRNFVPSACVFAVIFPLVGGKLGTGLFLLPLLFVVQITMNVGIALLVSSFVTLVPDATSVMQYVTRVLFFATPVVYPVSLLPSSAKLLIAWQPLYPVFACYQAIFAGGVPSPGLMAQATVSALFLVVVGTRVFLRHEREFAMHL